MLCVCVGCRLEGGLSAASREGWARGLVLQALARAQRLSDVEARVKKDSDTDTDALNALLLAYKVAQHITP